MSYYKPIEQGNQQIRLRFSKYANEVLQYDMFQFKENKANTFINTIIRNFYESANASINMRLNAYRYSLEEKLSSANNQAAYKIMINSLILDEEKRLCNLSKSYDTPDRHSKSKPYRLQNDLYEEFTGQYSDFHEDKYYPKSCANYIRTLIEEYSRLPYITRERVYYKAYFDIIESAIKDKQQLLITTSTDKKYYTLPYKILSDSMSTANYLTGYSYSPMNNPTDKYTVSYKISSIKSIKIVKSKSGYIHPYDVSKLVSDISEKGVQFLISDYSEIKIRFTANGLDLYKRLSHLRPEPISITKEKDGFIAVFKCSLSQANAYFFKFGGEAVILSPHSLRNAFIQKYQNAISSYSKET